MPKNFLVGIGGSGARVAEAALFLCSAGFGPDKFSLFLIDPDKGNGNLGRTTGLISKYLECRKLFVPVDDKVRLFRTEIEVPENEKDRVWGIFTKTDTTLSEWLGYEGLKETNRPEYDLMSILFSKDELSTKLNEGFRGHPAIGSVVMSEIPEKELPFKMLWNAFDGCNAFDLRLFLVGSVFGGTGAAGFPTLGHRNTIKFSKDAVINEKESKSKILLGGALILPYFRVVKSGDVPGMYVTSNDFPIATKAAMEFYDTKESLGIDQIYFIGDSMSHDVGEFSYGSTSQENKPHYIEIVSTLASFDFFNQAPIEKNSQMYFISKREDERVDWKSFPVSRNEVDILHLQDEFKAINTTMTIFCYVLATYGKSILDPENDSKNNMEFKQPWYEHFSNKKNDELVNLRTAKNKEMLKVFVDYAEDYLNWLTAISSYPNVDLIDNKKLMDTNGNWNDPVNRSFIGEILKETSSKKSWADKDGFLQSLNAEDINKHIKENTKTMLAANKFLNLFYEGSKRFAKNNFSVTIK
jgi:hypothetical protein